MNKRIYPARHCIILGHIVPVSNYDTWFVLACFSLWKQWRSHESDNLYNWNAVIKCVSHEMTNDLYILVSTTGDPLHSRAACTQPCNVNTHSRAHCSPGARLCEQWGHGCVNNGARLCASARLCRGSPVSTWIKMLHGPRVIPIHPFCASRSYSRCWLYNTGHYLSI